METKYVVLMLYPDPVVRKHHGTQCASKNKAVMCGLIVSGV